MGSVWGQGTLISGVRSLVLCLVPGAVVTTMPSSMGGGANPARCLICITCNLGMFSPF